MGLEKVFEKTLSSTERSRHWITVPAAALKDFPPRNKEFQVKVGSLKLKVYIDSNKRMLGLGWRAFDELDLDSPNTSVVIEQASLEEYVLKKKKQRSTDG